MDGAAAAIPGESPAAIPPHNYVAGNLPQLTLIKSYGTRHGTDVLHRAWFFRILNTMKLKIPSFSFDRPDTGIDNI